MEPNKTHEMPPPGASLLSLDVEKAASEDARTRLLTKAEDHQRPVPTNNTTTDNFKMTSSRRALLSVTLCLLFFFGLTSAGPSKWHQRVQCREGAAPAEGENFQSLVEGASPNSLHNILHKTFPGRFQHGVWESEKQAIEAVHRDNAPLATAILRMAKRDDPSSNATIASSTQQPTPSSASSSAAQVTSSSSSAAPVTTSSSSEQEPEPSTTSQAPPTVITTTSTTSIRSTSSSVPQPSPSSTGTSVSESEITLFPFSTSSSASPASSASSSEPSSEAEVSFTTSSSSASSTTFSTTSRAPPSTTQKPPQTTQEPQQPDEPMTPSSKVIVQTLTSTSDGVEIVVTQTSTVRVDPTPTLGAGTTKASPSLQNAGSSLQQQRGTGRWLEAVVLGAMSIFFLA